MVILNARKALLGIQKKKPQLYNLSGVDFLERRISQMLNNNDSISAVFKQPITNLKECLNEVEKIVTQTMSGNSSEDFGMRLHTLERKKDNIMDDMRVLTMQAVHSHVDELTNSYVNGDSDIFESIANTIFMDINDRYEAKLNEMVVFVKNNFENLNLFLDNMSNLVFDSSGKEGSRLSTVDEEVENMKDIEYENINSLRVRVGFFDFLKSRKKREKEKQEKLEQEAKIRNERAQYRVQENIRKKQEARQLANSDLDVLYREFNAIVNKGMNEKYDDLISQIQQIDCINKQVREDGQRQMSIVREIREELAAIQNEIE